MGFIVLLCYGSGKSYILHLCSYKSNSIVRSVIGGECCAFADWFDWGYTIPHAVESIIGKKIPLKLYTNSDKLFSVIVKKATTTERQLMIDVMDTREAYGNGKISDIGWVRSKENSADFRTKRGP